MRKTTVYLADEEAEGLRRLAAVARVSQAELIRQAVRGVIEQGPPRSFHSMGKGASDGSAPPRWSADELHHKVFGLR